MELKPGYKRSEVGVIPEDWETDTLLSISCQIMDFRGRTPKKLGMEWGSGDIPALSAGNVRMGFLDFKEECYFGSEQLYHRWMTKGDLVKDDIVFTTEAPLGNVALVPDNRRYILSQRTVLLQVDPNRVSSRFLFQVMLSGGFQRMLANYASGSTARGIQRKKFEQLCVPMPPLHDQGAIATALNDVDALLGGLARLIAKKRDLKQAAMQQLLTGQTRLSGFSGEWEPKRLSEIASIRNQKVLPSNVGIDTPCVELDHIGQGNGRLLEFSTAQNSKSPKYRFFSGDVLFGRLRSYLRKFWHADRDGICTTEIWPLMTDSQQVDSGFLHAIVQSDRFIEAASISYGTHMPRADWGVLRNFEVRLPRVCEQLAIADVLTDMDAELAALEARRDKTRDLKQAMMQELLTGKTRLVAVGGAHA